jgi:hypothetical protein
MQITGFNPQMYKPQFNVAGGEKWPDGEYKGRVIKVENKPATSTPNAFYDEISVQCLEGPMQGKTHALRLNFINPNAQAVEGAYKQFAALLNVTSTMQMFQGETQILVHGQPFIFCIREQRKNKEYSEIFDVKFIDGRNCDGSSGNASAGQQSLPGFAPNPVQQQMPQQPAQQQQYAQQPQPQQNWSQSQQQQQPMQPQQNWSQPQPQPQQQQTTQQPQQPQGWGNQQQNPVQNSVPQQPQQQYTQQPPNQSQTQAPWGN